MMKPYQDSSLEKVFNFNEQDLRANRQGKLSDAQVNRIRGHSFRVMFAILGALTAIVVMALLSGQTSPSELTLALTCVVLPIAAFTFAFTVGITEAALGPRTASKVSGQIHLAYGLMAYAPPLDYDQQRQLRGFVIQRAGSYRLVISDRLFQLDKDQYEALAVGYYAVYFVPTINKIVSIQRIDPDITTLPPAIEHETPAVIVPSGAPLPGEDSEEVRA